MVSPLKSLFLQSVFLPLGSMQILFMISGCYWCSQRQCFSSVSGRVTISDVRSLFCTIIWLLRLKLFIWKALGYEVKGFGKGSKINKKWGKLFWQRDISYVSKPEGEEGVIVRSQGTSRIPHLVCEMTGFSSRGGEEDGWTWRYCIGRIVWIFNSLYVMTEINCCNRDFFPFFFLLFFSPPFFFYDRSGHMYFSYGVCCQIHLLS